MQVSWSHPKLTASALAEAQVAAIAPHQLDMHLLPASIRKPPPQSSIRIQTHQSTATGTIAKASTARL